MQCTVMAWYGMVCMHTSMLPDIVLVQCHMEKKRRSDTKQISDGIASEAQSQIQNLQVTLNSELATLVETLPVNSVYLPWLHGEKVKDYSWLF